MSLLFNREEISDILEDPATSKKLKISLQQAQSIRQYASQKLALPDNKSYLYYVDIGRPYVVWNVFAAPEFSLKPTNWCYPIVGCVSYRGYFSEQNAALEADNLKQQNLDVYMSGIAAYSTLGWFNDPLLNTMLQWKQRSLAGLIFHELSHQLIYIKNETSFNEAFSSSVERLGTIQWLIENKPEQLDDYLIYLQAQSDFRDLLLTTRHKLDVLYSQSIASNKMRQDKLNIIETTQAEYAELKKSWPTNVHFDSWFNKPINNARLTSTMTYLQSIPAFLQFFIEQKGEWASFYQYVIQLEEMTPTKRKELIKTKSSIETNYPALIKLIKLNLVKNH